MEEDERHVCPGDQMIRVLEALQQNMRVLMNEVAERSDVPVNAEKFDVDIKRKEFEGQMMVSNLEPLVTLLNLRAGILDTIISGVLKGDLTERGVRLAGVPEPSSLPQPFTLAINQNPDAEVKQHLVDDLLRDSLRIETEVRDKTFGIVDIPEVGKLKGSELRQRVTDEFYQRMQLDAKVTFMKASRHASLAQQKLAMQARVQAREDEIRKMNADIGFHQREIDRTTADRADVQGRQRDILEKFNNMTSATLPKLEDVNKNLTTALLNASLLTADAELLRGMYTTQTTERDSVEKEHQEVMNQKRKLKQQLNLQKRRLDYMHTELDKKVHLVARTHEAHAKMKIDYNTTVRTQGVTGSAEDVKEIRELQRQRAEYDEQVTSIVSQITQANSDIDLLEHQKRHMLKVYFAEVGKPPPVLPDGTGYATTDQSVPDAPPSPKSAPMSPRSPGRARSQRK